MYSKNNKRYLFALKCVYFLGILFVCMFSVGCSTEENFLESPPFLHERDLIWENTYQVINKRYYVAKADKEDGTIETEWNNKMSLSYLRSYRDRVHAKIEEYKPGEGIPDNEKEIPEPDDEEDNRVKYVVKIRVERQQNRNIDEPESVSKAMWFPYNDNQSEAQLLLHFVKSRMSLHYTPESEKKDTKIDFDDSYKQ